MKLPIKRKIYLFFKQNTPIGTVKGALIFFVLFPALLVLLFQCMASHSLLGGFEFLLFHPYAFLCNLLILSASFSLGLLSHRPVGMILIIALLWFLCAFVNFILLFFRVLPFTGSDFLLIPDAIDIAAKYLNIFALILIVVFVAALLAGMAFLLLRAPSFKGVIRIHYPKVLLLIAVMALTVWGSLAFGKTTGLLDSRFRELTEAYLDNGFIYCFSTSIVDMGVSKPENYSKESMELLAEVYETESGGNTQPSPFDKPNIILVQLESFFDLNRLKDVAFSQNPLPNFTRLMQDCGSGYLNVPVIGAGTVNTEFEVLTGMNIDDFGAGEYPYTTILKGSPCETIAYNLSGLGYSSHAVHNHEGDFYSRHQIYRNLGFDTFTSLEYMLPSAFTPMGWAKDEVLTGEIENALDATSFQDFVFTVSVQPHGSYPTDGDLDYEKHLTVSSAVIEDEDYLNQLSYYANQIYETDQFVGDLVALLQSRPEDSILILYGDHLPSLELTDEQLSAGTVHQTEYVIWNNMGLTFPDEPLESYTLSSQVLSAIGVSEGSINAYHQRCRELLQSHEITAEDYLTGLAELEYDLLYGDKLTYGGVSPYVPTSMQMGIRAVSINSVMADSYGTVTVTGKNFTPYSQICINGKAQDTFYQNAGTIQLRDTGIEPGDEITVTQKNLSSTKPYIYR